MAFQALKAPAPPSLWAPTALSTHLHPGTNTLLQLSEHFSLPTRKTILNKIIFLVYFSSQGNSFLNSCPFLVLVPKPWPSSVKGEKALLWHCGRGANWTEDCNTLSAPCPEHLTPLTSFVLKPFPSYTVIPELHQNVLLFWSWPR